MYMGTAAISSSDYVHACIDHADLILMVGHDVVEKPPFFMVPSSSSRDGTKVVHINYFSAQVPVPLGLLLQLLLPDAYLAFAVPSMMH